MSIIWQVVSNLLPVFSFLPPPRQLLPIVCDCLTSLVGGDGHRHGLFGPGALGRDSVHRPHLEGVVGVGLQLVDGHPVPLQAQLLRAEVDAVAAGLTAPAVGPAALAHHVVRQVLAPARAAGRAPLQVHRGLVHVGDEVDGRRRRTCGGGRERTKLMF